MNEQQQVRTTPLTDSVEPTAGMLLRRAREATGLHVAALAVAMKVPVKKLEALEADRLHELQDAVFVRALAASVCRALKTDPAPVLSRLPLSVTPRLAQDGRGVSVPVRARRVHHSGNSAWSFGNQPAALWVLGLLLAALVVLYFPEVHTNAGKVVSLPAAAVVPGAMDSVSNPVMPQPAASAVAMIEIASPNPIVPASVPFGQLPAQPASASAVTAAALERAASATGDLLVFKAKSTAWVRVKDAKGAIQFEKTLGAGETAATSATLPLTVVVGNVSATELLVRGQPFNLEEVAKNNIARFEVK
jgi:cytoskeleton protein RodZ